MTRRVVCAAMRSAEGIVICSPRHYDRICHELHPHIAFLNWSGAEQGFVDQFGAFLSREEAWKVALEAGQIIRRVGGDGERLYSENLY